MGKRKERRLAAKNASGRRVKLDLFAEPSGDLGGSSAKGEVGGDGNSKNHAGSPNSPSSSGHPPEDPLSLLGQYSDDDLDDESSELINHTVVDTPPKDFDNQVNIAAVDKECEENTKINSSMDHDSLDIGEHNIKNVTASTQFMQELQESSTTQKDSMNSVILHTNSEPVEHVSTHLISDMQVNGDECSGWKMVLHEESNQYYYWNTLTGETSWNVPDILAQQTILASEVKSHNDTDGADTAVVGIHELNSAPDICADENCKKEEMPRISQHLEVLNEEVPSEMPKDNSGVHDVQVALHHDHSSPEKLEAYQSVTGACSGTDMQNTVVYGGNESRMDLCSRLLRLGEFLLERLDTLKGSKGRLIGHDKISKYTVEVEMRLSDIKSLATHGSSLLPFWLHCDKKFKQLESAISDEVLQFYESVELNAIEANENIVVHPISKEMDSTSVAVAGDPAERGMQELHSEADDSAAVKDDLFTSNVHVKPQYDSNLEGKCEAHEAAVPDELTLMPMVHLEEDVDMDVEMELEDVPSSHTTYSPSEQQPVWPNSAAEHEGAGIPPPPDDDWIPPPPPDDEPFPPPPPDNEPIPHPPPEEVSGISYPIPLPDPMTLPSFSYTTQQYNINYTGSSLEYYGQSNAEVQENNYYAADTNQINVPLPSLYYEAVPHAYPAPADVNPGEHGSYYGLQDEAAPPVPGVTCVQSSIIHIAAGQGCEDSDQIQSEHITLPTDGSDVRACENKSVQVSLTSVSDQATNLVTQVSSMSSIPAVPEPLTAAVPKVQSKVPRNKKRATAVVSTLKSNKKVSSLVDKWKAAKEELHEEEDEPENAYEMLEKKRQREIEEWRAQQIASGEAKDNANFQPLGGDWRERVKRKRARLMKKSLEDLSDNVTNGNQRPDLDKLKRDLPSGWQAYWDDASKQVYYGNSVTSETTWIKPT